GVDLSVDRLAATERQVVAERDRPRQCVNALEVLRGPRNQLAVLRALEKVLLTTEVVEPEPSGARRIDRGDVVGIEDDERLVRGPVARRTTGIGRAVVAARRG